MQSWAARMRALRTTTSLGAPVAAFIAIAGVASAQDIVLDPTTVIATKTEERVSDTLAGVSVVRGEELKQTVPTRAGQIFESMPGVWTQERPDDPSTAVNIRGLQDFGRVAVTIDGARQNFQRTGHAANGVFYVEPETIGGVDIVRGPTANIYGSGAIGGVVSFRTKDAEDILRPGEKYATELFGLGSMGGVPGGVGSVFSAARMGPNAEIFFGGTFRHMDSYKDAHGDTIPNTGNETWTGMAKATFRPADGHQIKLGYTHLDTSFVNGQPGSSILDTGVVNQIATARWTYFRPEDRVFNFDGNVYWTRTDTDQLKLAGGGAGAVGDTRNFKIDTVGFDFNNTSRFESGPFRHAFTWGVDGFRDEVNTSGFGVVFTPSGERSVAGGFVQLRSQYSTWLEVISALRYDQYKLEGGGVSTDGSRVSPKITVALTQNKGFVPYVTYAEGYRAPALSETLVAGAHPVFPFFNFYPNPALKPEVGKNKEIGINIRRDGILTASDIYRAKINVFRNDVDDYIDQFYSFGGVVPPGAPSTLADGTPCANVIGLPNSIPDCVQFRNIAKAQLEGVEFDSTYDAGSWFAGLSASKIRGKNVDTGDPLATIAPWSVTTTFGIRSADRRFTAAVRWQHVGDKKPEDIPVSASNFFAFPPTDSYNLVNLYMTYQVTPNAVAGLTVENLFNEQYSRYLTSYPNPAGTGNPIPFPSPGITVKGSYRVRFAG